MRNRWSYGGGIEFQNVRTDIVTTCSLGRIEGVDCIKHLLGQTQPYCGLGSSSIGGNTKSIVENTDLKYLQIIQVEIIFNREQCCN